MDVDCASDNRSCSAHTGKQFSEVYIMVTQVSVGLVLTIRSLPIVVQGMDK